MLLPAVVLGWSVATKWLDLQQEMLQLEREKVRLLSEQARIDAARADVPSDSRGIQPPDSGLTDTE